jgi:hypothetical protein
MQTHGVQKFGISNKPNVFAPSNRIVYVVISLLLIVIAAARPASMIDFEQYRLSYEFSPSLIEYIKTPLIFLQKEPGYFLIESIFKNTDLDFRFFLAFIAITAVFLKMTSILKLSTKPVLSVLLYVSSNFVMNEMIQIRSGVACGLFLFGLHYLVEKRYWNCFIFFMIASMFHYSALILAPLVFVANRNDNIIFYCIVLFVSIILAVNHLSITRLLEKLPFLPFDEKLNVYISSDPRIGGFKNFKPLAMLNLLICVLIVVKSFFLKSRSYCIFSRIFLISQILYYLLSDYPVLSVRFSYMLEISSIILIPILFSGFKSIGVQLILTLTVGVTNLIVIVRNIMYFSW